MMRPEDHYAESDALLASAAERLRIVTRAHLDRSPEYQAELGRGPLERRATVELHLTLAERETALADAHAQLAAVPDHVHTRAQINDTEAARFRAQSNQTTKENDR